MEGGEKEEVTGQKKKIAARQRKPEVQVGMVCSDKSTGGRSEKAEFLQGQAEKRLLSLKSGSGNKKTKKRKLQQNLEMNAGH